MRTYEKVKGAPIFVEQSTRWIGKIADLVFSKKEARVIGFWLFTRKWSMKRRFIPIENIFIDEKQNLYINKTTECMKMPKDARKLFGGSDRLHGSLLYENSKDILGIIEDVYFLLDSGNIVGYELTEGLFADLKNGIKLLRHTEPLEEKEGSFFV